MRNQSVTDVYVCTICVYCLPHRQVCSSTIVPNKKNENATVSTKPPSLSEMTELKTESSQTVTCIRTHTQTHTHTHTQPFYGSVDFVRDNPGEQVPEETFTHSHSSWSSIIPICFLHLLQSMASSLFNRCVLQSFSTISLQVFFGLPLGLAPSIVSENICNRSVSQVTSQPHKTAKW